MKDTDLRVTRKEQMLHKVVIVDGFPGCGKTMLSPIISSFNRVEIMQFAPTLENMCQLSLLKAVTDDVAESMIRMNCDLLLYWVSMGRQTNCRPSDLSSIFKDKPFKYIKRMLSKGDEVIPEIINKNKPLLHLTTHQLLPNAKLLFNALSDKLIFLELVRHPLYMVIQQEKNFEMYEGPRNTELRYSLNNKEYPFFVTGWEELFKSSNSFEKAIYTIQWYFDYLFSDYDQRIEVIPFEQFVINPDKYMDIISSQLGSPITKHVIREMKNQKVPREKLNAGPALEIYKRFGWEPPKHSSEKKELEARREYLSQNVSKKALSVLDSLSEKYESKFLNT